MLEVSALAQQAVRAGGPALLFERVKGSRFPLLINTYATRRRISWALGVPDLEEHARAILALVKSQPPVGLLDKVRMLPKLARIAAAMPKTVRNAPCQEVVESEPDLGKLPVLTTWPEDGGPYITLPMVITRDPDKGTRNVGCYRMQVYDRAHDRHALAAAQDRPPPHASLQGARPAAHAGGRGAGRRSGAAVRGDRAAARRDRRVPVRGFLRRKPVEMVQVQDRRPGGARLGRLRARGLRRRRRAAPRGAVRRPHRVLLAGRRLPGVSPDRITRRESPIYATTVVGPPPQEDAWLGKATERLFLPLLQMTFPEIVDMNLPIEGVFHNLCIVSIKKDYPHHARKICHSLWGMGQMMFAKCIVVVDDDVNVQNVREVAWRALNNIDAKRDVFFAEGPIDVLDHASPAFGFGGKLGVDATRKWKEEGFTREWPEVLKMDARGDARMDALYEGARAVSADRREPRRGGRRRSRRCSTAWRARYDAANRVMSAGSTGVWRKKAIARLLEGLGEAPRLLDLGAGTLDGGWRSRAGRRARASRRPTSRARCCAPGGRSCHRGRRHRHPRRRRARPALPRRRLRRRLLGVLRAQPARPAARPRRAAPRGAPRRARRHPRVPPPRQARASSSTLYNAHVLPLVGWAITGDREAYRYLPDSIAQFRSTRRIRRAS